MKQALWNAAVALGAMTSPAMAAAPRPIHTPAAQYPSWAIGSGISTEVELRVLIGREGIVRTAKVVPYNVRHDILTRELRASFDSAAVRAVRRWTFRPATEGDRPVSVWWTLRVPFSDPENEPASEDSATWIVDTLARVSPEPIEREEAEWPVAVSYGCRGRVTVRIFLGPDGRAWAVNVSRSALSCQDPSLRVAAESAVLRAARRWRYEAGEHEGDAVPVVFRVPSPRTDVPVVVGCVRDSATGRLRPEAEIFGRGEGHAFGMTDDHGWFVLRGRAAAEPRLRALESSPCRAGGFRQVHPWKQPGDEVTLYTARCRGGLR
ncbi:MAG TPA: energy transducer TonB [Candidatus Eisenbacteria bacterium]|nr:energy transducer TonB [Candidatus Eisenbacteria bacterium]